MWGEVPDSVGHLYPFPSAAQQTAKPKETNLPSTPLGAGGSVGRASYVPLMNRKRGDIYEDKVKNISGTKKERFQKHIELKGKLGRGHRCFFSA